MTTSSPTVLAAATAPSLEHRQVADVTASKTAYHHDRRRWSLAGAPKFLLNATGGDGDDLDDLDDEEEDEDMEEEEEDDEEEELIRLLDPNGQPIKSQMAGPLATTAASSTTSSSSSSSSTIMRSLSPIFHSRRTSVNGSGDSLHPSLACSAATSPQKSLVWINDTACPASAAVSTDMQSSSRPRRKSSLPTRAPQSTASLDKNRKVSMANGGEGDVIFKFVLCNSSSSSSATAADQMSTRILMTSRPHALIARRIRRRRAARLSGVDDVAASLAAASDDLHPLARSRRRARYHQSSSSSASTYPCNNDDGSYPTSELFYSAFADNPDAPPAHLVGALGRRRNRVSYHNQSSFSRYVDLPVYGDEYEDGDYEDPDDFLALPVTPKASGGSGSGAGNAGKKRKPKNAVKKPRAKAAKCHGEKICMSCKTNQTPIWREVKEAWGDGWEEILLCNACGLQWRMAGLRCSDCNYVPRASEKRVKKCTKCESGHWYRKG